VPLNRCMEYFTRSFCIIKSFCVHSRCPNHLIHTGQHAGVTCGSVRIVRAAVATHSTRRSTDRPRRNGGDGSLRGLCDHVHANADIDVIVADTRPVHRRRSAHHSSVSVHRHRVRASVASRRRRLCPRPPAAAAAAVQANQRRHGDVDKPGR